MGFDVLTGTTDSLCLPLLPEAREMTSFGRWELVSQVPEECFYLTTGIPL